MEETKTSPEKQDLKKELEGEILTLQPAITCKKGSHFFIRKSGTEVLCTNCPIGYNVGLNITVDKGHLYDKGQLVI